MTENKSLKIAAKMYQMYVEFKRKHEVKEVEFIMPEIEKETKK